MLRGDTFLARVLLIIFDLATLQILCKVMTQLTFALPKRCRIIFEFRQANSNKIKEQQTSIVNARLDVWRKAVKAIKPQRDTIAGPKIRFCCLLYSRFLNDFSHVLVCFEVRSVKSA